MAILRRNAGWLGLATSLAFLLLAAWWILSPVLTSHAMLVPPDPPTSPTQLTRLEAARVGELRRDSGLDDDALGCMGLSDAQLDTVLTALRSWYSSHSTALATARAAIADAQANVRVLRSRMDTGGGDSNLGTQLADAISAVTSAQSAYETLLAGARSSILANQTTEQIALVDRLRSQRDLPMPFRAVSLTSQQRSALLAALSAHFQRVSVHGDAVGADIDWAATIGSENVQQIASINTVRGPASSRVVAALSRNLPVEPDPMPQAGPIVH